MKKFLLSACALFMAVTASAQVPGTSLWSQTHTAASEAAALYRRAPLAVAADGSVFATGNFDQSLTIGSTTLEPIATSAYLAKYSDKGAALWAVALRGAAQISAVDADAEGNVFVAGTFADKVIVGSTDNKTQEIMGKADVKDKVSAFIVKYDANGQLKNVRIFLPTMGEAPADLMYLSEANELNIRPSKLQVVGDKVYIGLTFTGDVKVDAIDWKARYLVADGFMVLERPSAAVFTVSASDLSAATSVALFQNEAVLADSDISVEDVNFVVDGTTVYTSFVGVGAKTLTTANGTEKIALASEGSNWEHSFVVSAIGGTTTTKVFHNDMHDKHYLNDVVRDMKVVGDKLYLAGTFYKKLGFKPEVVSHGGSDIFVTALNKSDLSVQWAAASGLDEGDESKNQEVVTGMLVEKDQVFVTGYTEQTAGRVVTSNLSYNFSSTGATSVGDNGLVGASATNGKTYVVNRIDGLKTTISAYNVEKETSVSSIVATEGAATAVYTLDGKRVATEGALPAGIYLVKTGDAVRKLMVK